MYRIGVHVPTPGIDTQALAALFEQAKNSLLGLFDMFAGGALSTLSVFALGIMPYISASIILQLLTVAVSPSREIIERGRGGQKEDNAIYAIWDRYPEYHSRVRYCGGPRKYGRSHGALHRHFSRMGISPHDSHHVDGGDVFHHVAGRNDYGKGDRERDIPDHLCGYRLQRTGSRD